MYDIGDQLTLSATFTKQSTGEFVDPDEVKLMIKSPSGVVTTLLFSLGQLTKDSQGHYHAIFEPDESGQWFYKFYGTGAVVGAGQNSFYIENSEFE